MTVELLADLITELVQHKDIESRIIIHENIKYIQQTTNYKLSDIDLKIRFVLDLVDKVMFTPSGVTNWNNRSRLEKLGYKVTKDKPNAFGDSPIVIHTPVGCIAYG